MSTRELLELRRALERLRDALAAAVQALDAVAPTTERPADYDELGAPFGSDAGADRLWDLFGQYTTRN